MRICMYVHVYIDFSHIWYELTVLLLHLSECVCSVTLSIADSVFEQAKHDGVGDGQP